MRGVGVVRDRPFFLPLIDARFPFCLCSTPFGRNYLQKERAFCRSGSAQRKNERQPQSSMERCSTRNHENATADPSTPSATADSGRDDTSVGE